MKAEPLLLDIPEQFETERLIVRAPRFGDGGELNAAIRESVEQLRPWMPWVQQVPTVEDSESHCRRARAKFLSREDLYQRLFLKESGAFVGSGGFHRIDWDVPKFEIGYWIRTSFARQGNMTEAVQGMTHFAFDTLKANRVEIRCDERNRPSWRVAERCGFTLEGTLRNNNRGVDGSVRNTRVYSKIALPEV